MDKKIEDLIFVGTAMELKNSVLGNDAGVHGVCYHSYQLGGRRGWGFIFPNGSYDGFSKKEILEFFDVNSIRTVPEIKDYQFTNVFELSDDFLKGVFRKAWDNN